jgi:methylmalonyl-CoA/ethylmalonyl-CoA epimerase
MEIRAIDHICFAVKDLDRIMNTYREDLGLVPEVEYTAPSESIRVARYYVGGVAVEFMEPTKPDSDVGRFIQQRGEGFFLISYRVDNLDEAMAELRAKGRRLIDKEPRQLFGSRYAFIQHPKDLLGGVLTELLEGEFDITKK